MKFCRVSRLYLVASCLILLFPTRSYGAGFAFFTGGVSVWSFAIGLAGEVTGVGVVTAGETTPGRVITAGGAIVTFADPQPATFVNGSLSLDFDPNILEVTSYGWLGDWGFDPTLVAPPVVPTRFIPTGTTAVLQAPNDELAATVLVDNVIGNITATYEWVQGGYIVPADVSNFNFFSIVFTTRTDLSEIDAFYRHVAFSEGNNFNYCIPPGAAQGQLCGSAVIAEPSWPALMVFSTFALVTLTRRRRQQRSSVEAIHLPATSS